jgi:hypothetical protein
VLNGGVWISQRKHEIITEHAGAVPHTDSAELAAVNGAAASVGASNESKAKIMLTWPSIVELDLRLCLAKIVICTTMGKD